MTNTYFKISNNLGSSEGGVYGKGTSRYYVKFPNASGQNLAEQIADAVYEALGADTLNHRATVIGDREASVSLWNPNLEILGYEGWFGLAEWQAVQAARIALASILTKNWDMVGLEYDNVAKDTSGHLHIVDTGGSFQFRAQGEPKEFDGSAEVELQRMFDPNCEAGAVLSPLLVTRPWAFVQAARTLAEVTTAEFEKLVGSSWVASVLHERQQKIVQRFI